LILRLIDSRLFFNRQSEIENQQFTDMDGVLVIDKPAGPSSHDVVARMRRVLGTSRIGHTGTLDPFATGVLPLVIGRATRLASFLSGEEKEYDAGIRLGLATETYDGSRVAGGAIAPPAGIDHRTIDEALGAFRGTFEQVPPPYSAKKIEGVAAYKLARQNKPVVLRPSSVTVSLLVLDSYEAGLARVRVRATAGFYVRSLAHDLGQRLGCGAHLESLRRIRAGALSLDVAIPLNQAEADPEHARASVLPLERLLPDMPAVTLNERGVWRATHGNDLGPGDMTTDRATAEAEGRWRLLDATGTLLGIGEARPGRLLHPILVLV
jgi:tRNA pseudouridine55 synthase